MKYIIATLASVMALVSSPCFADDSGLGISGDRSIRVSLGLTPGTERLETEEVSGHLAFSSDDGVACEILAVTRSPLSEQALGSPLGSLNIMAGAGIFFGEHSGTRGIDEIETSYVGVMVQIGLAVEPIEGLIFEVGPYAGIGSAKNELTGFKDGRGLYTRIGAKAGVFMSLSTNVELGVEIGYEQFYNDQEIQISSYTYDATFSGNGTYMACTLAFKF